MRNSSQPAEHSTHPSRIESKPQPLEAIRDSAVDAMTRGFTSGDSWRSYGELMSPNVIHLCDELTAARAKLLAYGITS